LKHTVFLQLFAHSETSEEFSIISVIIFEVNIVAEQKQAVLITIFCFSNFTLPLTLLLPRCRPFVAFRNCSLYLKQLSLFRLLWLISACADRIGYFTNFSNMTELLHELKNSRCYHRSIQTFDNDSAGKKEN